ncbi:MAG: cytosine permease [Candidatus Eremiobacteraeota bacterium]|nr:cytosine permease [Candidatus Eremiobacteraeota bacterium]
MEYKDRVLEIEPLGTEFVPPQDRHGSPRSLFGLWFSANAEIATWMVGLFTVALYGTSLRGAIAGIILGNVLGFGLLGILSTFGPRYGVPQMVASRLAFGWSGNAVPAALSFLAGVGWFAINTVFGAYALQSVTGLNYFLSLLLMIVLQVVLAVYGYNMIHAFERIAAILLAAGFIILGIFTWSKTNFSAGFNPHAPFAAGGETGGIILATALGFSYATGWIPCASDYSRYLPSATSARSIWWYSFLGCAIPCIALQIMGAATVTAVGSVDLSNASPTQAINTLLGSGIVAKIVLLTVVLGTLTSNCMNLYSGAMAALVVKFPKATLREPLAVGAIFAGLTALLASAAHASLGILAASSLIVGAMVGIVARFQLKRWRAAIIVGIIGAVLASGGGHPEQTAKLYTNGLLLLSYWASPWAAVVFVDWISRRSQPYAAGDAFAQTPAIKRGTIAWIGGLLASLPFWDQAWFTGPFAANFPQFGDLSYFVGFVVAGLLMYLLPLGRTV